MFFLQCLFICKNTSINSFWWRGTSTCSPRVGGKDCHALYIREVCTLWLSIIQLCACYL